MPFSPTTPTGTYTTNTTGAGHGQWQSKQLGGMEQPKQHNPSALFGGGGGGGGYGNNNGYAIDLAAKEEDEEKERRQQQHCFLLGTDLRLDKPSSGGAAVDQRPLRPFFDEWPHEKAGSKGGSWMGLEGETQLSVCILMAAHNDLPITTTSGYHHGE